MRRSSAVFLLVLAWTVPSRGGECLLRDGDRVVFYGDSITEQMLYTRYVEAFVLCRFPSWRIRFANAGWGGDTTPRAEGRLARDVEALRPTVVTHCFGMNDGRYTAFQEENLERFLTAYRKILERLAAGGARQLVISPGIVDMDRRKGPDYNATLERFAAGALGLAAELHVPAADLFHPMRDANRRAKAASPSWTMIPDSVHPGPPGQLIMAAVVLEALGVGAIISDVAIDARSSKVLRAEGATVAGLRTTRTRVAFTRLDEVWPWRIPDDARDVLPYFPRAAALDRYRLAVSGLAAGRYRIAIDGREILRTDAPALATGVDISLAPGTPWDERGKALDALVANKSRIDFHRWRHIRLGLPDEPERALAEGALEAWIRRLEAEMDLLRRPRPTRWVVERAR